MWLNGKSDVGKILDDITLQEVKDGIIKAPWSSDQSTFMKMVGKGPFMDAFGEFHDGLHSLSYMPDDQVSLIVTMPPSYVLTVAAAMQPHTHLYLLKRNKKRVRE